MPSLDAKIKILILLEEMSRKIGLKLLPWCALHDRFRVDIYNAHVLISIAFAVFEYLDTALATENKILRFSRAVLPYKTRSSNVNLALIFYFRGQTSYKRVTISKLVLIVNKNRNSKTIF